MIGVQRLASVLAVAAVLALTAQMGVAAESATAPGEETAAAALSLEQAIEMALRHNPQVSIAEQGVRAGWAQVTQATSYLMPQLTLNAQRTTPVNLPSFSFQSRDSTLETQLSISQPLYTGGSLQKGAKAARGLLRGAEGTRDRTRQQIAYAVREAYYAVLTAEEGVKVAQEVLGSAKEHLRVAQLRFEAGVAPQYDVLAAEARVARVEQQLISVQSGRDIAWAALGTVIGVPIAQGTALTTPLPVDIGEGNLEELTQEAIASRPDLQAANAQVGAAAAQVAIARAARHPRVTAAATYSFRQRTTIPGEDFGAPGTELVVSQSSGMIALAASWSLFNGGRVFGEITAAEAALRQAEHGVESLRLQIALDVRSAFLSLKAAQAQLLAARKEAAQAEEAHRIAKLRYTEGVGTSVEILDAEANLEGAKTRLNEAAFGLNLAVAQLDLAVGRPPVVPIPSAPEPAEAPAADAGEPGG